jgi:uncharacterized membrane protein
MVVGWIIALVILTVVVFIWYQNNETEKAMTNLKREIDRADRVIEIHRRIQSSPSP